MNFAKINVHGFSQAITHQTTLLSIVKVDLSVAGLLSSSNQNYQFYPQPAHFTPLDPMILIGSWNNQGADRKNRICIVVFLVKTFCYLFNIYENRLKNYAHLHHKFSTTYKRGLE